MNKRFAESLELDYPILSDPKRSVAAAYGVVDKDRPYPRRWTFIIGLKGELLYIDKKVKAGTHGDDLVKKLGELGVARKK